MCCSFLLCSCTRSLFISMTNSSDSCSDSQNAPGLPWACREGAQVSHITNKAFLSSAGQHISYTQDFVRKHPPPSPDWSSLALKLPAIRVKSRTSEAFSSLFEAKRRQIMKDDVSSALTKDGEHISDEDNEVLHLIKTRPMRIKRSKGKWTQTNMAPASPLPTTVQQ